MRQSIRSLIAGIVLVTFWVSLSSVGWAAAIGGHSSDGVLLLSAAKKSTKKKSKKKKSVKKSKAKTKPVEQKKEKAPAQDDADLFSDDAAGASSEPQAESQPQMVSVLLDLSPADASEAVAQLAYDSILETLRLAPDLGEILSREDLGKETIYRHVVKTCRGMDNYRCLRSFAAAINARIAFFGEIRDLDDLYLVYIEMLDVKTGRSMDSIRVQVAKPGKDLREVVAQATCRLTRPFGCERQGPPVYAEPVAPVGSTTPPLTALEELPQDSPLEQRPVVGQTDDSGALGVQARQRREAEKLSGMEIGGWVLASLGVGAAAGGIAMTVLMYQAKDDYDNATTKQQAEDHKDTTLSRQWTSIGLYAGAAALGAVGIGLIIAGYQKRKQAGSGGGVETPWIAPAISPEGAGVVLGTSF